MSSPLIDKIAAENNIEVVRTLTGFKYIGEIIAGLKEENQEDKYFFGYEESNGFLASPFICDKDGVSTALLIACMAAQYKSEGIDLFERLNQINASYGRLIERIENFVFEGIEGEKRIANIMDYFRTNELSEIARFDERIDFLKDKTGMPKADVLIMKTESKSTFIIRPSGTEPKIKLYMYLEPKDLKIANKLEKLINGFTVY